MKIDGYASTIEWLLAGDNALRYQVERDLLGKENLHLRHGIASKGWGAKLMNNQNDDGGWGKSFYQPKWTNTHYTLLMLRNLDFPLDQRITTAISQALGEAQDKDGGINPAKTVKGSDVCVSGMFLNFAAFFKTDEEKLKGIVDFLISAQMDDGGFNCFSNHGGARHSSVHSTLSVLEGINEYLKNGYAYQTKMLMQIQRAAEEFLLIHRLFKSDKTGEIISPDFVRLHFPNYWHYDILRALVYFCDAGHSYDERMQDALDLIIKKRRRDARWALSSHYPGQTYFEMEKPGKPSRWVTFRALRVIKHFI